MRHLNSPSAGSRRAGSLLLPRRDAASLRGASSTPIIIAAVVLLALAAGGWYLLGSRNRARETAAAEALRQSGALVVLDGQKRIFSANLSPIRDEAKMEAAVQALADMPNLPTLDVSRSPFTDEHAKTLSQITGLTSLMMNNTKITDAAMQEISGLTDLTSLGVANTEVTGEGLKELQGMDELNVLDISGTQVSGGLEAISQLPKLNWVNMRRLKITDDSLVSLAESDSIGKITLDPGSVSDETLQAVRKADPKLVVDLPNFGPPPGAAESSDADGGDQGDQAAEGDADSE